MGSLRTLKKRDCSLEQIFIQFFEEQGFFQWSGKKVLDSGETLLIYRNRTWPDEFIFVIYRIFNRAFGLIDWFRFYYVPSGVLGSKLKLEGKYWERAEVVNQGESFSARCLNEVFKDVIRRGRNQVYSGKG